MDTRSTYLDIQTTYINTNILQMIKKIKNSILTNLYIFILHIAFRYKVYYEDGSQKDNPPQGIYITNHMSLLDGILMRAVLKKADVYSLITEKWYNKKWARALLFYEKTIPVNRNNPGTEWLHKCRKLLKEGKSINIFPEGHVTKQGPMDVFKPGFLLLASMSNNIPIIPVATVGKYKWFFGERKRILIGKPIAFDKNKFSLQSSDMQAYAEEFREIIKTMREQLEKDEKYR